MEVRNAYDKLQYTHLYNIHNYTHPTTKENSDYLK